MKKNCLFILFFILGSFQVFAQVDYESQIQTIFNARCTSCHGSSGGITLTSYEALINSDGNEYGDEIIVPGNPDASGLVDKIEPDPMFGSRMPLGGSLDQSQIDLIRQWITEGANEVPTSNEGELVEPNAFRLLGNYPNPFNPGTQIQFETPSPVQYTIRIYTAHGQLISEQVGYASAGLARVNVNLGANPTGMYLYRVTGLVNGATQFIGAGKMTLIK